MLLIKKINFKRYLTLAGFSTLIFILFSQGDIKVITTLIVFSLLSFLYQFMLMIALDEILRLPPSVKNILIFERLRRKLKKSHLSDEGGSPRKKRFYRHAHKNLLMRRLKSREDKLFQSNIQIKRNNWKILFFIIGKLLIFILAIGLSVQFIGDKIILPVINHVFQILALSLSIKREHF